MKIRTSVVAPWLLAAASLALPAWGDPPPPSSSPRPPREPAGMSWRDAAHGRVDTIGSPNERYLRVRYHVSLPAGPGCTYEGNVRGHIVAVMQNPPWRDRDPVRYRPRLSVRGQVVCGNRVPAPVASRALGGGWVTGAQLEQLLREAGAAQVRVGGGLCTYTPEFALVRGHVVAGGVRQACSPGAPQGWGGGPR